MLTGLLLWCPPWQMPEFHQMLSCAHSRELYFLSEHSNILSLLCSHKIMILICSLSQSQPLTQSFIYTSFHLYEKLPVSTLQTLVLNPIISVHFSLLCTVKAIYFKWANSSSSWPLLSNLEKETRISFSTRGIHQGLFHKFKKCLVFQIHSVIFYIIIYISKNETGPFVY